MHQSRQQYVYAFRPDGTLANPTISGPDDFNAEELCNKLRAACSTKTRQSKELICNIIGRCTNKQRQQLAEEFKSSFGECLVKDLKKVLSGDLEKLVTALMMTREEYCAEVLKKAMEGAGTDEKSLIHVLTTQTNKEMKDIKECYQQKYGVSLEDAIEKETSGTFKNILVALIQAKRDEISASDLTRAYELGSIEHLLDKEKARQQAQELYDAGEAVKGVDAAVFVKVLVRQSHFQMPLICDEYRLISEHSLEEAIKKEFSGLEREALVSILDFLMNPQLTCAKLIQKACQGLGTNENLLNYVLVTRSEIDMKDVKTEYKELSGKTLKQTLKEEVKGEYRELLNVLAGNDFEEFETN